MQSSRVTVSVLSSLLMMCLFSSVRAQQKPSKDPLTELALEVTGEDRQPFEVPAKEGQMMGIGGYPNVPSWKPPVNQPAAAGILIKIQREGDVITAAIFIQLENEKKIAVATYKVREDEIVSTTELASFGFKPLILRLKPPKVVVPSPSITPVVTNDLKAVQVAGLYKADPPRESYKVSLLNISPKNIVAIYFFTPNISGKGGSSQFNTGSVDRPLIKSGEVYTEDIGAGRNVGYPPPGSVTGAPRAQWISVRTVIFDDGTYEGDADQAAGLEARGAGLRSQRIRIIELLKQSVSKGPTEPVVSLDTLKENVYALGTDPESVQVEEVISKYPALTVDGKESVRFWVKSGMGSGKHEIVGSIERFEELMKASPEKADVAKWLKETIARFEAEVATK